jgi:hypothetical protein
MNDIPKEPISPSEEAKAIKELYKNDKAVLKSKIGTILSLKRSFNAKLKNMFTSLRDIINKSTAAIAASDKKKNTYYKTPEYKDKMSVLKEQFKDLKDDPDYKMIKNYPGGTTSKFKVSTFWKNDAEKAQLAKIDKLFYVYANTLSLFEHHYNTVQDNINKSDILTTSLGAVNKSITDLEKDKADTEMLAQQLSVEN